MKYKKERRRKKCSCHTRRSRNGSFVWILQVGGEGSDDGVFSGSKIPFRIVGGGDGGRVVRGRHPDLKKEKDFSSFVKNEFFIIFICEK